MAGLTDRNFHAEGRIREGLRPLTYLRDAMRRTMTEMKKGKTMKNKYAVQMKGNGVRGYPISFVAWCEGHNEEEAIEVAMDEARYLFFGGSGGFCETDALLIENGKELTDKQKAAIELKARLQICSKTTKGTTNERTARTNRQHSEGGPS